MVVKFNSQQKIVAVLAVRAGSQRVPEKNIRKFHDTNLLELKLNVLTRCKQIDEIVVNSDSEEMLEIGRKFNVSTHKREDYFASSKASNSEFHGHIAEMTEGDVHNATDQYSKQNKIGYVHFRNVVGKVPFYKEVFVDEGDIDMVKVLRILKKNNFEGVLIPDHTPQMSNDGGWYSGMAYAMGFMKAAMMLIKNT